MMIIPNKCPKCEKEEDLKTVCGHCGYEYKYEKSDSMEFVKILMSMFFSGWLAITAVQWFIIENSLFGVFKMQYEWFKNLSIF